MLAASPCWMTANSGDKSGKMSLFCRAVSQGSTAPSEGERQRGISDCSTAASHMLDDRKHEAAGPNFGQEGATGLACGAYPTAAFPNSNLLSPPGVPKWCPSHADSALQQLRRAVQEENWERHFAQGLTRARMHAEWNASPERCASLQRLVAHNASKRVLELGSFCGASSLALAEALPEGGEVHSLEMEPFVVEFGKRFQRRSFSGSKINTTVCHAKDWLEQRAESKAEPFDLVLIDADKEGMQEYFDLVWCTPGLLSAESLVCVDVTSSKSQPPLRYAKYGFRWEGNSNQAEIDTFRKVVSSYPEKLTFELGGLLILQRSTFFKGVNMSQ